MALIGQGQDWGRKSQSGSLQTLADIEALPLPHHIKAFSLFVYSYNAFNQNN